MKILDALLLLVCGLLGIGCTLQAIILIYGGKSEDALVYVVIAFCITPSPWMFRNYYKNRPKDDD